MVLYWRKLSSCVPIMYRYWTFTVLTTYSWIPSFSCCPWKSCLASEDFVRLLSWKNLSLIFKSKIIKICSVLAWLWSSTWNYIFLVSYYTFYFSLHSSSNLKRTYFWIAITLANIASHLFLRHCIFDFCWHLIIGSYWRASLLFLLHYNSWRLDLACLHFLRLVDWLGRIFWLDFKVRTLRAWLLLTNVKTCGSDNRPWRAALIFQSRWLMASLLEGSSSILIWRTWSYHRTYNLFYNLYSSL